MAFSKSVLYSTLLLTAVACDNSPSASAPATTGASMPVATPKVEPVPSASAAPTASGEPARKPRRPRSGLAGPMFAAASELELPADKKASIDKLGEALGERGPNDPESQRALQAAFTEGVKAGKVELAKLEPTLTALDKAAAERKDAEVKALDGLHKELDAAQRKALVEAVKKHEADRGGRFKERGGQDKDGKDGKDGKAGDAERAKRRLERLSGELGLDADQQKKVEPILMKHDLGRAGNKGGDAREEMKKRMDALLAAFEKDTFSAAKLEFGADAKRHREMAKKKAEYLNALLGVLKPEQRDKLAATVDDGPRGGRGSGPRGPRRMRSPGSGPPPGVDEPGDLPDDD